MPGPLCVSIFEPSFLNAARRLKGQSFAELRLDAFEYLPDNLEELVRLPQSCLLTCRPSCLGEAVQMERLKSALTLRPDFLDLDLDAPEPVRRCVEKQAAEDKVSLVLSKHWYGGTPGSEVMEKQVAAMLAFPDQIVKVAAMCRNSGDLARLLGLYATFNQHRNRLVVLGMGPFSSLARLVILQLGAPFTFVAANDGLPTAEGQLSLCRSEGILAQAGLS